MTSMAESEPRPDEAATDVPTPDVEMPTPMSHLSQAWDRCDKCGAQAFVKVAIPTAPTAARIEDWLHDENRAAYESITEVGDHALLFCAHHHHEHEAGLAGQGAAVVVDERAVLHQKIVASY